MNESIPSKQFPLITTQKQLHLSNTPRLIYLPVKSNTDTSPDTTMAVKIQGVFTLELVTGSGGRLNTLKYRLADDDGNEADGNFSLDLYIENLDGNQVLLILSVKSLCLIERVFRSFLLGWEGKFFLDCEGY